MERKVEARWAETCAGLLEEITGRIPAVDEEIDAFGLSFRIVERVGRRLHRVGVRRVREVPE
jgi:CBS domain containing-hemolysin-like protein